ncbi:MAG: nucleotidyltransferase domain-containing protein [Planctomycetota bacterium]
MLDQVLAKRDEIERLCQQHHAILLSLTGSAAAGDFDPDTSDLDFLVRYRPGYHGTAWDDYWGLKEGLEALFKRKVDLIDRDTLRNPYVKESMFSCEKEIYAAA